MVKLVYIGGYGRSGSTLLEYLLTTHPAVVACGEVERHLRRFGRRKVCTCGRRLTKCPIWGTFQHRSGRLRGWDHEHLDLALLEHVQGEYAVMVDSSKTAWGSTLTPLWLSQKLGQDFLLVHLVRDPRGVCWSAMRTPWRPKRARRPSAPPVRALRASIGWTVANVVCEMFGWRHRESYLRVRYEDLIQAPAKVIEEILHRVSITSAVTLEANHAGENRHQLYGNAMRFKPLSLSELKEDVAWKTAMPKGYRLLITCLCWPLDRRYGYGRDAGGSSQRLPIAKGEDE